MGIYVFKPYYFHGPKKSPTELGWWVYPLSYGKLGSLDPIAHLDSKHIFFCTFSTRKFILQHPSRGEVRHSIRRPVTAFDGYESLVCFQCFPLIYIYCIMYIQYTYVFMYLHHVGANVHVVHIPNPEHPLQKWMMKQRFFFLILFLNSTCVCLEIAAWVFCNGMP